MAQDTTNLTNAHMAAIEPRKRELLGDPLVKALGELRRSLPPEAANAFDAVCFELIARTQQLTGDALLGWHAELDALKARR